MFPLLVLQMIIIYLNYDLYWTLFQVFRDKGDNPATDKDANTNMESASSESPELEVIA